MVLVVYGFVSQTAALQFEWAWQHPDRSLDVRDAANKVGRKARYGVRGKVLMLMEMLNAAPWRYYPLTVQFLKGENAQLRAGCPAPPPHIPVEVGPLEDIVEACGVDADEADGGNDGDGSGEENNEDFVEDAIAAIPTQSQITDCSAISSKRKANACCICTRAATRTWAVCGQCNVRSHIGCLAEHFLAEETASDHLNILSYTIPTRGSCPQCGAGATWSSILEGMKHAGWAKHKKSDTAASAPVEGSSLVPKKQRKPAKKKAGSTKALKGPPALEEISSAAPSHRQCIVLSDAPWLDAAPPTMSPECSEKAIDSCNDALSVGEVSYGNVEEGSEVGCALEAPPWDDYEYYYGQYNSDDDRDDVNSIEGNRDIDDDGGIASMLISPGLAVSQAHTRIEDEAIWQSEGVIDLISPEPKPVGKIDQEVIELLSDSD